MVVDNAPAVLCLFFSHHYSISVNILGINTYFSTVCVVFCVLHALHTYMYVYTCLYRKLQLLHAERDL